jgi:hypothetical protein
VGGPQISSQIRKFTDFNNRYIDDQLQMWHFADLRFAGLQFAD